MAELHWFPVFVADWLTSDAITLMLPEQEGAFFRLLLRAWGKGVNEPSLDADDATLATLSRLGRRWAKLGALVREQFEERDGRLYNAKLSEVWNEQQTKHGQAVVRGQNSAKARADKRQTVSKQSRSRLKQLEVELEREEEKSITDAPSANGKATPFPKPLCDAAYERFTARIGSVDYGRFRKAFNPIYKSATSHHPDELQLYAAIEAFAEARESDPKWMGSFTVEKLAQSIHNYVRLGTMPLMDEWGEPTERGIAAKVLG